MATACDILGLSQAPPWHAAGSHRGCWWVSTARDDPADEYDVTEAGGEAEARLGAAAPELFEVARWVATEGAGLREIPQAIRDLARSGVAKAMLRTG